MRKSVLVSVLLLSACGGGESAREVSRVSDGAHPQGMTYEQFSRHKMNDGAAGSPVVQKRFLLLDRDNNGVLSSSEFSDY